MKSKLLLAVAVLALSAGAGASYAKPDANILAAVADAGRPAEDTKRDADRKPAEMLEFAGVKKGQTVVDFLAGGGYFTRIFSKAVGPTGVVYAVTPPPRPPQDPSKPPPTPAIDVLAADPAYANVKSSHQANGTLSVPTKADLVWTSLNYHDLHLPNSKVDIAALNKAVYDALKPGGYYVIIDHSAPGVPETTAAPLHRIDPAIAKSEVEAAGFKLVAEGDTLHNTTDDHTLPSGKVDRGHTDQFMLKFQKPK